VPERILHVWNTAGVASVIAKFTDREFGTSSRVITRLQADRVGLTTYGVAYNEGAALFFARALLAARGADLVHVHSLDRILPWLRAMHPRKPLVMHYHGTDIEGRWSAKERRWKCADYIAYSTPNLSEGAPPSARHAPNPVDTDLFYPRDVGRDDRRAVSFRYGMDRETAELASKLSLELVWAERWSIPHAEMPAFLSRSGYYIDLRKPPGRIQARSVGKAALEALACGCKVIDWEGNVLDRFPPEHDPRRVAAHWHGVYADLISGARPKGSASPS
jgi:glycosyltransferase involved in cell wall biosynthesis